MEIPAVNSRSIALVLGIVVICVTLAASAASAWGATGLDSAVVAGSGAKASGTGAACAREAKRKALRSAARASTSSALPRNAHRTKEQFRRRCLARYRRAAKRKSQAVPATTANPAPLAIGIDGGDSKWWDEEVEFRKALNAPVTRHEWDPTEPVDAQDALVLQAASEVHTRIHALLGGNELGDPNSYRDFVVAFIRRYGVGGTFWAEHPTLDASKYAITTFELGNEPYFGTMTATQYAETVRPTLEAVHQLGLPAKLILPSYIYGTNTKWIDTLYQLIPNLNSLFYAFADHPYWYGHAPSQGGDGNSPFERIDTLRKKMAEHGAGSKPLFITEYGESTADCGSECVSESVQAEHISEMIQAVTNHPDWGVELLCLYQLHDWSTNSSNREEQFGLLNQDGTPKPAYAIARAAMQQYRG
jgi:hypothetical protein